MNFATKGISTNLSYTARTRSPNLEGTTLKSCVHGVLVTPGSVAWEALKAEKTIRLFFTCQISCMRPVIGHNI